MNRFHFKLQDLLNLWFMEENRAKNSFLLLLTNFQMKEVEIEELVRRREQAKVNSRECSPGDIESLLHSRLLIGVLFQKIAEKQKKLEGMRPELEEARAAHRRAAARRQALEKVHHREWTKFLQEKARREQKELDEIGQVRFLRRQEDRQVVTDNFKPTSFWGGT